MIKSIAQIEPMTPEVKPFTPKEKVRIREKYQKIVNALEPLNNQDRKMLEDAFAFSQKAHENVRRRDGQPYIMHPLNVSLVLIEEIGIIDILAIIAALLHDVVEDTAIPLEEIQKHFGNKVKIILDALTKIDDPNEFPNELVSRATINFQKIFSLFAADKRIGPIKIADRLDNMRSLEAMPSYKQLKIAHETKAIYVPLAHRLGFGKVKTTLEDLYLKFVHPHVYKEIARKLRLKRPERKKAIEEFATPVLRELTKRKIAFLSLIHI